MPDAKLNMPIATGPGIYGDEADSMAQSLSLMGGAKAEGMLQLIDQIDTDARAQTKGGDEVSAVKFDVLIRLANLVTGSWGKFESAWRTRRKVNRDFIGRMQELLAALDHLIDGIATRKPSAAWIRGYNGGKTGGLLMCRNAVQWVLTEGMSNHTIFNAAGYPLGQNWGILAKGNGKLPFWAYSELPMATCPGAGICAVYPEKSGWCYSFKAWRYPDAFARQFLNTLANVTDEFFHFNKPIYPIDTQRTKNNPLTKTQIKIGKAYYYPGERVWMQYIKALTLNSSVTARKGTKTKPAKVVFLRLFVDGDIHNAPALEQWMEACRAMGEGMPDTQIGRPKKSNQQMAHVEVYGYSKAWQEFELVSKRHPTAWWPKNYTLNLSSGSRHANKESLVKLMESLPISRGYFAAVNLSTYMKEFMGKTTGAIANKPRDKVQAQVDRFVEINNLDKNMSESELYSKVNAIAKKIGAEPLKTNEGLSVTKMRERLFKGWVNNLSTDPYMRHMAEQEMIKDNNGKIPAKGFSEKRTRSKIIALHLMDVLWAYDLGGSCPLVCGNCFDVYDVNDPYQEAIGVHRCASKPGSQFGRTVGNKIGPTINIGLH